MNTSVHEIGAKKAETEPGGASEHLRNEKGAKVNLKSEVKYAGLPLP